MISMEESVWNVNKLTWLFYAACSVQHRQEASCHPIFSRLNLGRTVCLTWRGVVWTSTLPPSCSPGKLSIYGASAAAWSGIFLHWNRAGSCNATNICFVNSLQHPAPNGNNKYRRRTLLFLSLQTTLCSLALYPSGLYKERKEKNYVTIIRQWPFKQKFNYFCELRNIRFENNFFLVAIFLVCCVFSYLSMMTSDWEKGFFNANIGLAFRTE